ncbi:Cleavage stimulation factor subunit 2 [Psilocybe cubensis]|uniref:Cleavage stimulation factor subunit 2 n=1 Tax=Psilocybe cubensis TaxID=181762 RepID=A0ACB8GNX0_PSICU|nr:Cleavage stimulation factor subunit 2 [Psilocybe cubensis]KAH9477366.1 Cleavage stimulation factor subunit 2 [Psilocybe cubensis]
MTEEQIVIIFKAVGQVVGFRLAFDRDTEKPKGYGFCEFADHETALLAVRNLNNTDCGGRSLRVDLADLDPLLEGKTTVRGRIMDRGYTGSSEYRSRMHLDANDGGKGQWNDNDTFLANIPPGITIPSGVSALDHIKWIVAELPESKVREALAQMKAFVITYPEKARTLLIRYPQLAYALCHSLVLNRFVDPIMIERMLASSRRPAAAGSSLTQSPIDQGPTGSDSQYPLYTPYSPLHGLHYSSSQLMPTTREQSSIAVKPHAHAQYLLELHRICHDPSLSPCTSPLTLVEPPLIKQQQQLAQIATAFVEMDPEQQRAISIVLGMTQEHIDNIPEPAKSQIVQVSLLITGGESDVNKAYVLRPVTKCQAILEEL